jgi:hypothetical protein
MDAAEPPNGAVVDRALSLARFLDDLGVAFALGGAIAYSFHGVPRQTRDIDINLFVPESAGEAIVAELQSLGVRPESPDWLSRMEREGQVRLLWDETPVDLFFAYHDFHAECRRRAVLVPFGPRQVPVLSAEDLAVFKVIFNRRRDWADVERMLATRGERFDRAYARHWLVQILGEDDGRLHDYDRLLCESESGE